MSTDDAIAKFENRGDPAFVPVSRDASVLPYGETLTVGAVTCVVDEHSGVTCDDSETGHGFTVSDAAYE